MTKKKMISVIFIGVFLLFCCATLMNYMSAKHIINDNMQDFYNSVYLQNADWDERTDLHDLHHEINGYNPTHATHVKPAYAYGMVDRDGNVIFKSESGMWWQDHDDSDVTNYVSFEEYMTSEVKAEIMRFKKQSDNRYLIMREAQLNFDGEKYRPVSFTLDNQRDELKTFVLSDLEVTDTVGGYDNALSYEFYDLDEKSIDHLYYVKVQEQLEQALSKPKFRDEGSGASGGGSYSNGEFYFDAVEEDYYFYYCVEYGPFYETVTSNDFYAMTVYTAVLFGFVTVIILIAAVKLFNKNQRLVEAKRAFTSAAAHELKTPLAVIQNQCECVMDNIAPEKNGEYVRSIYDEAVKMNGIVQTMLTFNRLSDMDSLQKERCNLSGIVKAELKKYESFALSKQVTLTAEIEENVFAECNGELIAMAVDNYLSNAVKYARYDKIVSVALKKNGSDFSFEVYNDGDSITQGNDIWELLTRGDKARTSSDGSTGMGLPICRKIFNLHSYNHWFHNGTKGVTFVFSGKCVK